MGVVDPDAAYSDEDFGGNGALADVEGGADGADSDGAGRDDEGARGVFGDCEKTSPRTRRMRRSVAMNAVSIAESVLIWATEPSGRSNFWKAPTAVSAVWRGMRREEAVSSRSATAAAPNGRVAHVSMRWWRERVRGARRSASGGSKEELADAGEEAGTVTRRSKSFQTASSSVKTVACRGSCWSQRTNSVVSAGLIPRSLRLSQAAAASISSNEGARSSGGRGESGGLVTVGRLW